MSSPDPGACRSLAAALRRSRAEAACAASQRLELGAARRRRLAAQPASGRLQLAWLLAPPAPPYAQCPSRRPATDVKLTEAAWPEGIAVEGELTAAFDSIPSGSSVQHMCVHTPCTPAALARGRCARAQPAAEGRSRKQAVAGGGLQWAAPCSCSSPLHRLCSQLQDCRREHRPAGAPRHDGDLHAWRGRAPAGGGRSTAGGQLPLHVPAETLPLSTPGRQPPSQTPRPPPLTARPSLPVPLRCTADGGG